MKTDACPDRNTLELLLLGKLPAPDRDTLGEHLLHCERCAATAETLTAADELTAALQTKLALPDDDEHVTAAILREAAAW